ncbi:MAG: hypothetical protein ACYCTV_02630 [Leptospirales bacterium]
MVHEDRVDHVLPRLAMMGKSSGGALPKVLIGFNKGEGRIEFDEDRSAQSGSLNGSLSVFVRREARMSVLFLFIGSGIWCRAFKSPEQGDIRM